MSAIDCQECAGHPVEGEHRWAHDPECSHHGIEDQSTADLEAEVARGEYCIAVLDELARRLRADQRQRAEARQAALRG